MQQFFKNYGSNKYLTDKLTKIVMLLWNHSGSDFELMNKSIYDKIPTSFQKILKLFVLDDLYLQSLHYLVSNITLFEVC